MSAPGSYALVAIVGHAGAGRSTLAAAIQGLAPRRPGNATTAMRTQNVDGRVANVFELHTNARNYQLVDFPDAASERDLLAAASIAVGVLVVSVLDGVMPGTRDSLARLRERSAQRVVVFLSKTGDDVELVDLVELEVRELLNKFEFDGDTAAVVRSSAVAGDRENVGWTRSVVALLDALDAPDAPGRHA